MAAASRDLGTQAVVACLDVVGTGEQARCVTRSGRVRHEVHPLQQALALQQAGAGEIIVQSVDRDGLRKGMDIALMDSLAHRLEVPVVALGGAGNIQHLAQAMKSGASAVASGSAFSFIGRLRAVLITYPTRREMDQALEIA